MVKYVPLEQHVHVHANDRGGDGDGDGRVCIPLSLLIGGSQKKHLLQFPAS
jgi:hypothetical protein